jgi:hypothetical protein
VLGLGKGEITRRPDRDVGRSTDASIAFVYRIRIEELAQQRKVRVAVWDEQDSVIFADEAFMSFEDFAGDRRGDQTPWLLAVVRCRMIEGRRMIPL